MESISPPNEAKSKEFNFDLEFKQPEGRMSPFVKLNSFVSTKSINTRKNLEKIPLKRRTRKSRKNHTIEIVLSNSPSGSIKSKKSITTDSPKNEKKSTFAIKLRTADNLDFELSQKKRIQRRVNEKRHRAVDMLERHTMLSVDEPEQITFVKSEYEPDELEWVKGILEQHFIFFFSKKANCKENVAREMQYSEAQKGECIYEEGDHAYYFFIISSGSVSLIVSDQVKKVLKKGDSFGDIALLYNSPRTGSIICDEDCKFWVLHRNIFQQTLRKIKLNQFKENKKFIENVKFFDHLSLSQRAALAMEMVTEKFQPGMNIVEEGNQANSFYIIKSGKVSVVKANAIVAFMDSHSYFGESALSKDIMELRSATVRAETEVECLSIGKTSFFSVFGDDVSKIVERNILRAMIRDSKQLRNLPTVTIQKLINKTERVVYRIGEFILKSRTPYYKIFFIVGYSCWEGEEFERLNMTVIEPQDVENGQPLVIEKSLVSKDDKCVVYTLDFDQLNHVLEGSSIKEAIERNNRIREIFQRVNMIKKIDSLGHFRYVKNIGIGGYGTVVLCLDERDRYRAIKIIPRESLSSRSAVRMLKHEKEVLEMIKFSFVVRLRSTFRDESNFYLIMDFINGIPFGKVLIHLNILTDPQIQFYLASVIIMIKYLHERSIIFRDLKPENIMCNQDGYLRLIDFGAAKALGAHYHKESIQEPVEESLERTFTMVGTPHYMAPEVVRQGGYSYSADFWSLGILAFEILCGYVPFGEEETDTYRIYEIIQSEDLEFPVDVENEDIMNLIRKLLNKAPESRVNGDIGELMADNFFEGFDWPSLITEEMPAPFIPELDKIHLGEITVSFKDKIKDETESFLRDKNRQLSRRPDLDISELDKYF